MLRARSRWMLPPLVWLAAGCAALPENFSELRGDRYHAAKLNTYPTRVTAVDGRSTMPSQNPVPVEPGEHVVTLAAPPVAGFRVAEGREFRFTVEPCKVYYFVAERDNRLQQQWRPVIDHVAERGGPGCR